MKTVVIPQITERLEKLPADKLVVVYDFVSYLLEREKQNEKHDEPSAIDGEEEWDRLLARPEAKRVLRNMAREALEDYHAGRTTDIIITDDGRLAPG
jgi:hypothetical protein